MGIFVIGRRGKSKLGESGCWVVVGESMIVGDSLVGCLLVEMWVELLHRLCMLLCPVRWSLLLNGGEYSR